MPLLLSRSKSSKSDIRIFDIFSSTPSEARGANERKRGTTMTTTQHDRSTACTCYRSTSSTMSKSSLFLLSLLAILSVTCSFTTAPPSITRTSQSRARPAVFMSEEESTAADSASSDEPPKEVKCPNCDLCDGSGRILGGIGVVLPWWPIKAYRPCPNFIEAGGTYQRSGQGLDEIAFGRDSTFDRD